MWQRTVVVVAAIGLLVAGSAQGARKIAPVNTSPPTISGTAREGELLTASNGSWSGSPSSFKYRWLRCDRNGNNCNEINNANGQTYRLAGDDVGHRLRVRVTATNNDGSSNATSSATAVIVNGEPSNTSQPSISGTARAGEVLTANPGNWTGTGPISYEYQWKRCDANGNNCANVGSNNQKYTLVAVDVGHRMRITVVARNNLGSGRATSDATSVVGASGALPANTVPPVISGTPRDNELLSATPGTWTNNPTQFRFTWLRCDSVGNRCNAIDSSSTHRATSGDVGHTLRVTVAASNSAGTSTSTSVPTGVVASATGVGAAISIDQVVPPQRLVVSAVSFAPNRLTSRAPFVGRFRVTDTRGNLVRGALVYAIALPYGWVRPAAEAVTGGDGWATIVFSPTSQLPLRRGAVVFFVRARKAGDSLLAGVSNRRLVQVSIG